VRSWGRRRHENLGHCRAALPDPRSLRVQRESWYDKNLVTGPGSTVRKRATDIEQFAADFDRAICQEDGSAAKAMLAAGRPVHILRDDTPPEHVLRVYPDGREELVHVDISCFARRQPADE
jgi:hypothetical protein